MAATSESEKIVHNKAEEHTKMIDLTVVLTHQYNFKFEF